MDDDFFDTIDETRGAQIARYVTGQSSPAEEAETLAWCKAAPGREEYIESLRWVWEQAGQSATHDAENIDDAWAEVRRRREELDTVPAPDEPDEQAERPAARAQRWGQGLRRAAVIAVIALGAGAVWKARTPDTADAPRAVDLREYATARAQRAEMRLPDGTRVVLNVDSRLRVPADYGKETRTVYLEGEALFEVEHDERRPFVVHTASLVAEDLGTVFGVRAYPDASTTSVVVAEGLVEFTATSSVGPAGAHLLEPRNLGRVGADGTVEIDPNVNPADYLAFADERLVFRNAPLRDVAAQLGRWYGLDVRLADSTLAGLPLTASFQNEPITHVLDLIALSLNLRYERNSAGEIVTFRR